MELSDLTLGFIGFGGMAQKDAPHYAKHVKRVLVSDINPEQLKKAAGMPNVEVRETNAAVAREADIWIVATTPISEVDRVFTNALQSAKLGSLAVDYTSVKSHVERAAKAPTTPEDISYTLMHPMRGPSLAPERQTHVLIHGERKSPLQQSLERLVMAVGGRVVFLDSAEQHDRIVSRVQSSTHFTYFALAQAYLAAGLVSEKSLDMPNKGYKRNTLDHLKWMLSMRLCSQHKNNRNIYPAIAALNPFVPNDLDIILRTGNDIMTAANENNAPYLRDAFGEVRDFLGHGNIKEAEGELEELMQGEFTLADDTGDSNISLLHVGTAWAAMGDEAHPAKNMIFASPPYKIMALATLASFGKGLDASIRNALKPAVRSRDLHYWLALQRTSVPLITSLPPKGKEEFYSQILTDTATAIPQNVLDYSARRSNEIIERMKS